MLQRTQIYLPSELRKEIDKCRRDTGESLAEFLRKAAEERMSKQKKNRTDLKKLAEDVFGIPSISENEADKWIKQIREDRREEDEHWEKRMKEALKNSQ